MARLNASFARASIRRRALAPLKVALASDPAAVGKLWPALKPLERAACWRLLPAKALPEAAASLSREAAWDAYLSQPIECLAPLTEDAPRLRAAFRKPTAREAALLRARLQ